MPGWRRLPATVAALQERWSLVVGNPFQPGGQTAWVAPVIGHEGVDLVLKVGWRHPEALHEADGLREWNGDGTVRLHDAIELDDTVAFLLERCRLGSAFASRPEVEQDLVVAGLLRRLWREPSPGHRFRPLQAMCDAWADEFEAKVAIGKVLLDPGLAREGIALFRALPATADRSVLLLTDLHADNVLAAEREPWLAIDPQALRRGSHLRRSAAPPRLQGAPARRPAGPGPADGGAGRARPQATGAMALRSLRAGVTGLA